MAAAIPVAAEAAAAQADGIRPARGIYRLACEACNGGYYPSCSAERNAESGRGALGGGQWIDAQRSTHESVESYRACFSAGWRYVRTQEREAT